MPVGKRWDLTGFEGGLDSIRVKLTKVGLKDVGILDEDRSPGRDQGVQSVEQDEPYRHQRVTKDEMIINWTDSDENQF